MSVDVKLQWTNASNGTDVTQEVQHSVEGAAWVTLDEVAFAAKATASTPYKYVHATEFVGKTVVKYHIVTKGPAGEEEVGNEVTVTVPAAYTVAAVSDLTAEALLPETPSTDLQ